MSNEFCPKDCGNNNTPKAIPSLCNGCYYEGAKPNTSTYVNRGEVFTGKFEVEKYVYDSKGIGHVKSGNRKIK